MFLATHCHGDNDSPEKISLIFNLSADSCKKLAQLYRIILFLIDHNHDPLRMNSRRRFIRKLFQRFLNYRQRPFHHDPVCIPMFFRRRNIRFYNDHLISAFMKITAIFLIQAFITVQFPVFLCVFPQIIYQLLPFLPLVFTKLPVHRSGPCIQSFLPFLFFPDTDKKLCQFLRIDRLQKIIGHSVFQRSLCILKLPVSTYHDKNQIRPYFLSTPDQFHSIHSRHPDICHQNIRLLLLNKLKCSFPVICSSCDLVTQLFPVHDLLQQKIYLRLVICNDYFQHNFPQICFLLFQQNNCYILQKLYHAPYIFSSRLYYKIFQKNRPERLMIVFPACSDFCLFMDR